MNTLFSDWLRGVKFWLYDYGLSCVAALPAYYFFSFPMIIGAFSDGFSLFDLSLVVAFLVIPLVLIVFFGLLPCTFLNYIIKRITKKDTSIFSPYDDNPWMDSPWGMVIPILISYPVGYLVVTELVIRR